jgi:type VI secretion system protein ImpM
MTSFTEVGFYGKVRTHGDFVGRGLPTAFVGCWDEWLQRGMLAARDRLGDAWLSHYLVMPLWCFALHRGVIDEQAYAGVVMPGLDAVGRYFPFAVALCMDPDRIAAWPGRARAWYQCAGDLALSTLDDGFSLSDFDAGIAALAAYRPADADQDELVGLASTGMPGTSLWWSLQDNGGQGLPPLLKGRLNSELFTQLLGDGSVG